MLHILEAVAQQTGVGPMLDLGWINVEDGGPVFIQH